MEIVIVFKGNGAVWDPAKERIVCTFENGEFRTSDEDLIAFLEDRGYEGVEELVEETPVDQIPASGATPPAGTEDN